MFLKGKGGGHFPLLRHLTGSLQSAYLRSKGSSWPHSSISENPDSSRHSQRWFWLTFGLLFGLLLRNRFELSKLFGPLFGFWPIKKKLFWFLTASISVRRSRILPSVSAGIKLWFFKCRYSGYLKSLGNFPRKTTQIHPFPEHVSWVKRYILLETLV